MRRAARRCAAAIAIALTAASCGGAGNEDGGPAVRDGVATGPTSQEMCAAGYGQTPAVAAYDRRTGAHRWSTCVPIARERRGIVEVTSGSVSLGTTDYATATRTIAVLDARTGATRSTRTQAPGGSRPASCGADPDVAGVVVDGVCISGGQDDPMVATDAETQKVLWTQPDARLVYDDVWAVGDGAVYAVRRSERGAASLVAYEVRTGRARWQRPVDPYAGGWPWLVQDGVLYCIWTNLTLVSTSDGSVLWRTAFPAAMFPRITGVGANADQVFVAFSATASGGD